jgi:hypothetical protein
MKLTDPVANPANSAASRPLILAAIFFGLGAALTGAWFHHQDVLAKSEHDELSAKTRNLLGHLDNPVALRFYSLLPAGSSADLQSFSGRAADLLAAVQAAGDGKIQLTRLDVPAETNANAATADGIQPFNLDQGNACFLGVAISSGGRKEALARLQPEWESALPSDLTRAILRVSSAPPAALPPREIAKPSPEIVSSIQRLIPDVRAISDEQADQIFHAEFMKDCAQAGTDMGTQMEAAQQQVAAAQSSGLPEDLAAAKKNYLAVQLAQGEKFKKAAADLATRMAVFLQMKASATNSAP